MVKKIQKALFWLWISTLVFVFIAILSPSFVDHVNELIIYVIIAGILSFLGFWLLAFIRYFKGDKSKSAKMPIHSIGITMLWVFLIIVMYPRPTESPAGEVKGISITKKCFFDGGTNTWIIVHESADCSVEISAYRAAEYKATRTNPTPTPVTAKTYSNKINCVPTYGPSFSSTVEQCNKYKAEQDIIADNYRKKYNSINNDSYQPTTYQPTNTEYTTSDSWDYEPPPRPSSLDDTYVPAEIIYSPPPTSKLEFIHPPEEKECYEIGNTGQVICK